MEIIISNLNKNKKVFINNETDKYISIITNKIKASNYNIDTHKNIIYLVNTSYEEIKNTSYMEDITHIIFTGPVDEYFKDCGLEKLEYRSIDFSVYRFRNMNYFHLLYIHSLTYCDFNFDIMGG